MAALRALDLEYKRRALQSCVRCTQLDRLVDGDCDLEIMRHGLALVSASSNGIVDFTRLPLEMCNIVKRKLTNMARSRPRVFTWELSKTGDHIWVGITNSVRENMEAERQALVYRDESLAISTVQKLLTLCRQGRAPYEKLLQLRHAMVLPRDFDGFLERHPQIFRLVDGQVVELVTRDEMLDSTASCIDVSTPEGEQHILNKFEDLIGLTLEKRCRLKLFIPLKHELGLPEIGWDSMLTCHPGIFYVSSSCMVKTAFLRKAYNCESMPNLCDPLVTIKNRYLELLHVLAKAKEKRKKKIFYGKRALKLKSFKVLK